ncbi:MULTISPECIES: hypothetical protein [unclassified Vibrio]|uniref:hypothetical protein n=1 Tax=unclassified Vibrio TaxID=2614977 RepID=UPI0029653B21|nr:MULTISPECIES: hypothetical protein [unclassified Vibrio]MDW1584385.1 hypothetical protein [Vibrio sp. Vb2897]MDW1642684.1 hypothetical protein [Vibrio sp. Vb2896]
MKVNTQVYKLNTATGELSEPLLIEHIEEGFLGFKVTVDGETHTVTKPCYQKKGELPPYLILTESAVRKYEQSVCGATSTLCETMVKFLIRHMEDKDREKLQEHLKNLNDFLSGCIDKFEQKDRFPSYARMWTVKGLNETEIRKKLIDNELCEISYKGLERE